MHTPSTIEQKVDRAFAGFTPGHVFFMETQTTRKPNALSLSGGSICHCNSLRQQDVRGIAPLLRCMVQGSLAVLLGLCFHKFSPAAEKYWDGARGLWGEPQLPGRKQ